MIFLTYRCAGNAERELISNGYILALILSITSVLFSSVWKNHSDFSNWNFLLLNVTTYKSLPNERDYLLFYSNLSNRLINLHGQKEFEKPVCVNKVLSASNAFLESLAMKTIKKKYPFPCSPNLAIYHSWRTVGFFYCKAFHVFITRCFVIVHNKPCHLWNPASFVKTVLIQDLFFKNEIWTISTWLAKVVANFKQERNYGNSSLGSLIDALNVHLLVERSRSPSSGVGSCEHSVAPPFAVRIRVRVIFPHTTIGTSMLLKH